MKYFWAVVVVLCGLSMVVAPTRGQDGRRLRPSAPPGMPGASVVDLRRRLVELDRLLTLKSVGRAESLLHELEQHNALERELIPRRIRLAQLRQGHRRAVDLCRAALADQPRNTGLWRSLTTSLLAIDQPDSARLAADRYLATSPNLRSAGTVAVELFQQAEQPSAAVGLIDSLRAVLQDPIFMGRQKATSLLALGKYAAAADEVTADLHSNPFNLSLVRTEILEGGYRPGRMSPFLDRLEENSRQPGKQVAVVLLLADLYLMQGDSRPAVTAVEPFLKQRSTMVTTLQNAVTLTRELPLIDDEQNTGTELQATVDYLLEVLGWMASDRNPDSGIRKRSADNLAEVCEVALERGALGQDPRQAAQRFGELLQQVRQVNPNSEHLYSSQIKLAKFTRDVLHQPAMAAHRLENMLLDLDLPLPGVALVRLTLGECYLAAGDTTRGRIVLTRLGRDPEFRQAAGFAHYHLARLDLAQGNLATARDRFAVVAMDNPAAPYANDALELGLAITEEMENPSGGPDLLLLYAKAVYFDLVRKPQERVAALEDYLAQALRRVDLEEPQRLLERARFELANAYLEQNRPAEAIAMLKTLVRDHPRGRYPAEAMMLESRLEKEAGHPDQARQTLERLLVQYPDYLFIDDARDAVRSLP